MVDAPERIFVDYAETDPPLPVSDSPYEGAEYVRADLVDARIAELEAENERLRYVLGGVAGAIKTGRYEPLMIWRDQIEIALKPKETE